jgi:hypothetical protein
MSDGTEIKCSNGDIYIIKSMQNGISIQKKECCTENIRIGTRHGDQHVINDNLVYVY